MRLDLLLVEKGLAESRARARALIEAGFVYAGDRKLAKPSLDLDPDTAIELRGEDNPWASRAGLKLAWALDFFAIDPAGRVCLDVGASTGGFTDVLLARGAARVHAVDVGHGQMVERLRRDPRVRLLERTNARDLDAATIPEPPELIVADVSFISLRLALPAALALAKPGALLVALVKPQFEVGRAHVGKGGIVRDEAARRTAVEGIARWLENEAGWKPCGIAESPVLGGDGNVEFLLAAKKLC